jgi:hypothetical protein
MNKSQRLLVIAALVIIGAVLSFLMLDWQDGWKPGSSVFIFYEQPHEGYSSGKEAWGLYTRFGVTGIMLGIVAPLCLLATAVFVALGMRHER